MQHGRPAAAGIHRIIRAVGVSLAAGLANFLLAGVVHLLEIPLYFDSIATIIVSVHLGLVPGLLTAVVTHVLLAGAELVLFPFVCCSMATAVIAWGFRTRGWLSDYPGYLWMGLLVALANGIGGSVLAYSLFEGVTEVHAIDRLVMGVLITGRSMLTSVFWAGMLTNLMDKLISVFAAFLLRDQLARLLQKPVVAREAH